MSHQTESHLGGANGRVTHATLSTSATYDQPFQPVFRGSGAVADWTVTRPETLPVGTEHIPLAYRLFEIAIASTVLLLTWPIMLAVAIVIRRGTPGPALFFQERVGINRKPFKFVKNRTLYADARQRFPELYRYQYDEDELRDYKFKVENDPRVTPQGRWLRETTLDELPNFINVLKGDMALVGPRPEIPEMLPYYQGDMQLKFTVRPGVTGLAQISGRGRLGFQETVRLDVEYVKNKSIWLDMKILLLTIWKVIKRDGAF